MKRKYQIDPEQLRELYNSQQLTLQEIADYYGCSREVIRDRIRRFNIEARTVTQSLQTQRSREKMSCIMAAMKRRTPEAALSNFEAKITRLENGCWEWQGATAKGYGVFGYQGRQIQAHRFAYEHWKGPIPAGLHLDHLCRNRRCVNPSHLESVTIRENLRRGESPNWKIHRSNNCKRGHDMSNAIERKNGTRVCRECFNRRWREGYRRRKAARGSGSSA